MTTTTTHRVKQAYEVPRGYVGLMGRRVRVYWYVVECVCGWSSMLHADSESANKAYKAHRDAA